MSKLPWGPILEYLRLITDQPQRNVLADYKKAVPLLMIDDDKSELEKQIKELKENAFKEHHIIATFTFQ